MCQIRIPVHPSSQAAVSNASDGFRQGFLALQTRLPCDLIPSRGLEKDEHLFAFI